VGQPPLLIEVESEQHLTLNMDISEISEVSSISG